MNRRVITTLIVLVLVIVACGSTPTPAPTKVPNPTLPPPTPTITLTPRTALGFDTLTPEPTWTPASYPTPLESTPSPTESITSTTKSQCPELASLATPLPSRVMAEYSRGSLSPNQVEAYLAGIVRAYSDFHDVQADGGVYRYTITFISNDVVDAVLVKIGLDRGLSTEEIQSLRTKVQSQLGQNNELAYILTVATSDNLHLGEAAIPVPSMRMVNTLGQQFAPERWDRLFDAELSIANGPKFGYVMFPAAVRLGSDPQCTSTIDFGRDTSIAIFAPGIKSNTTTNSIVWSIPLLSEIAQNVVNNLPTPEQPPTPQATATAPAIVERQPVPTPSQFGQADDKYWLDLADFVIQMLSFLAGLS